MNTRRILLASALTLALSACGQSSTPPTDTAAPAAATVETAAPAEAAPTEAAPTEATPPAATSSKPAVVANCATTIESNDAMQYNADSITVPASCTQFSITLHHVGKLASNVMGHNLVIAKEADMAGVTADGMAASPDHVKADDSRVIAHTKVVGGGESTEVSFDVAKLKDGGPFKFFCSFPGHLALMQGSIQVQ